MLVVQTLKVTKGTNTTRTNEENRQGDEQKEKYGDVELSAHQLENTHMLAYTVGMCGSVMHNSKLEFY